MQTLWQDLRYGLRMLLKNPGFTAVAVITLALGIGANTAIFSVVNAVLLRPLPYWEPGRLLAISETNLERGWREQQVSFPNFLDWKQENRVFERMAAFQDWSFNLTGRDEPEQVSGAIVSASFFSVLGVNPIRGRVFASEEEQPGAMPAVVLSYGLWQRCFGTDPGVIGQTLTLDGSSYMVIGIMPPSFGFPFRETELWTLSTFDEYRQQRGNHLFRVIARLKPGVTVARAQMEMEIIARRLEHEYPNTNKGWGVSLAPLKEQIAGRVRPALLVLFGAVGFVLLIACVNVANLLLARAAARQKEIAIRAAVGASHLRLVQQLLTESALLALLGGALGLLLAFWGVDFLVALGAGDLPRVEEIKVDAQVLGFTLTISLLTGIVFGLAPALQMSSPDLNQSLKEGGASLGVGSGRHRLRHLLVVSEVALALVLLIGAGLLIKSFLRLQKVELGFQPDNVLVMDLSLPMSKYAEPHRQAAFFQEVLQRVESLPGVRSAGVTTGLPLSGEHSRISLTLEGRPAPPPGQEPIASYSMVSPHYFQTMGIPLLKGRYFTEQDVEGAPPVVIINETMARRFWPDEDPIGKRLTAYYGDPRRREVVGVVGDVRHLGLDTLPQPSLYLPSLQAPRPAMTLLVRTASDPKGFVGAVKNAVHEVDKDQPVSLIGTMEQVIAESVAGRRLNMLLLDIFAALALILATVGIYGAMSHSVGQRTHEIGIRMALGARQRDVLKLILRQGIILALIGGGIGLAAALALTRLMSSLLFGVSATDPTTFATISLLLMGVALLACYIPARRATKVDPMVALRYE